MIRVVEAALLAIFIIWIAIGGWIFAHNAVSQECEKLGKFYVYDKTYKCEKIGDQK